MSDGIPWGAEASDADGVTFGVEIDGRQAFQTSSRESRWRPGAVDLTGHAGKPVQIALTVDAESNVRYDWAMWGAPRVLKVPATGGAAIASSAGVFAFRWLGDAPARFVLRPDIASIPPTTVEAVPPTALNPAGSLWLTLDASFPGARRIVLEADPPAALVAGSVRAAAYPPRARLASVSCAKTLTIAGAAVPLWVDIQNAGPGRLDAGRARVEVRAGGVTVGRMAVPTMEPGSGWRGEWRWRLPARATRAPFEARLTVDGRTSGSLKRTVEVLARPTSAHAIQNAHLRIEFVRNGGAYRWARLLRRANAGWRPVAIWKPLLRTVIATGGGAQERDFLASRLSTTADHRTAVLTHVWRDADGVAWRSSLRVALDAAAPIARLRCSWTPAAPRRVLALWGPQLYVGEEIEGERKTMALFPGLEYLYLGEPSSSTRDLAPPLHDRRTPRADKVTAPIMAVSLGPGGQAPPNNPQRFWCPDSLGDLAPAPDLSRSTTVALWWDPLQEWLPGRRMPSPRFSSPNRDEGMANHRMALFVPSSQTDVPENADRAVRPVTIPANATAALTATVGVVDGPPLAALGTMYRSGYPVPNPEPPPRPDAETLAICRDGYWNTLWEPAKATWRVLWGQSAHPAPGFAALLWLDAVVSEDPRVEARSMAQVDAAAERMLAEGGAPLFCSRGAQHIMRWEFPFLWGCLPEALPGAESEVRGLIAAQREDGGWAFHPSSPQTAELGRTGDAVMGSAVHSAWMVARWARVTGDPSATAAAERALAWMERFRVPRGAGPWECPIYEPDILAAAWGLAACIETYRATENPRWLNDALYWAETALPFIYHWRRADRPPMLGASIPVFGSTFYTHSWIGLPVQWEGLVLAYHLRHLAGLLERSRPAPGPSPLRPVVGLSPAEWRRLAEALTNSGIHQLVADGERRGTYPDSVPDFVGQNPPFINPENYFANLLAQRGFDPEIETARLNADGRRIVISAGGHPGVVSWKSGRLGLQLLFFKGRRSHTLVTGVGQPSEVLVDGQPLARSQGPLRREPGWWWDAERSWLFVTVEHMPERRALEIRW